MADEALTPPAAPAWLSAEARAALERPIVRQPYPPINDHAAWLELIGQLDGMIARMLDGVPSVAESHLIDIDGVPTYVVTPPGAPVGDDAPVYLDIHGGALIMGSGDLVRTMTEITSPGYGVVTWAPDYRMPPRHPFPAALDDIVAVYRALLVDKPADRIVVGGTSSGGNLASALLLRAKEEGLAMPAGLVLCTPEVDLTESGDSFTTLADVSVGLQSLREANLLYANGHDLASPLLSPLFGDLAGFPPTLLIGGTRDLFLSNTVRMHRRLREAGVEADLHVFDGRPHAGFGGAPEELAVTREIASFIHRRLGLT